MGHPYRAFRRTLLTGLLVVGLLITARTLPATANEVLTWNETALKAIEAGGQRSVQIPRALAMMQGAVHDALNTITPRYTAYYFEGPGDAGASPEAAVAAAAHTVLVGVISSFGTPAQKMAALAIVEEAYMASLGRVSDAAAKTKGVAVGRAAGAAMLALRKDDGATRGSPAGATSRPLRCSPPRSTGCRGPRR
jgi:hypothetical protein